MIPNGEKGIGKNCCAGLFPGQMAIEHIESTGNVETLAYEVALNNQVALYASTTENILNLWSFLSAFAILFALLSLLFLSRIDKDKRK